MTVWRSTLRLLLAFSIARATLIQLQQVGNGTFVSSSELYKLGVSYFSFTDGDLHFNDSNNDAVYYMNIAGVNFNYCYSYYVSICKQSFYPTFTAEVIATTTPSEITFSSSVPSIVFSFEETVTVESICTYDANVPYFIVDNTTANLSILYYTNRSCLLSGVKNVSIAISDDDEVEISFLPSDLYSSSNEVNYLLLFDSYVDEIYSGVNNNSYYEYSIEIPAYCEYYSFSIAVQKNTTSTVDGEVYTGVSFYNWTAFISNINLTNVTAYDNGDGICTTTWSIQILNSQVKLVTLSGVYTDGEYLISNNYLDLVENLTILTNSSCNVTLNYTIASYTIEYFNLYHFLPCALTGQYYINGTNSNTSDAVEDGDGGLSDTAIVFISVFSTFLGTSLVFLIILLIVIYVMKYRNKANTVLIYPLKKRRVTNLVRVNAPRYKETKLI